MSQPKGITALPAGPSLAASSVGCRSENQGPQIMGWGFSWSCPQTLHSTLRRYCKCGAMVQWWTGEERMAAEAHWPCLTLPTRCVRRWRFHVASGGRRGPAIRSARSAVRMTWGTHTRTHWSLLDAVPKKRDQPPSLSHSLVWVRAGGRSIELALGISCLSDERAAMQ